MYILLATVSFRSKTTVATTVAAGHSPLRTSGASGASISRRNAVAFLRSNHDRASASSYITNGSVRGGGSTTNISTRTTGSNFLNEAHVLKVLQVQVVHRHGDRTPITPMKDEAYWASELIQADVLNRVAETTTIVGRSTLSQDKHQSQQPEHVAKGRGPFGKLTQLGLLQMVQVGTELRSQLLCQSPPIVASSPSSSSTTSSMEQNRNPKDIFPQHWYDESSSSSSSPGHVHWHNKCLFGPQNPFHPTKLKVYSTDFPRTIQSVQGLLIGFLPQQEQILAPKQEKTRVSSSQEHQEPKTLSTSTTTSTMTVPIDVQYTNMLIPDPQPRSTAEQVVLETMLAQRPHIKQRDTELQSLAIHVTDALRPFVHEDAFTVSYGIGEEKHKDEAGASASASSAPTTKPSLLSWAQLSDIVKCLSIRNRLPSSITTDMQSQVADHVAWQWFEHLRHPRLAYLSMNPLVSKMVHDMMKMKQSSSSATSQNRRTKKETHLIHDDYEENSHDDNHRSSHDDDDDDITPSLYIYSAHDSTLIGLLCAFRLEQPAEWPEYASYFKMELIQAKPLSSYSSITSSSLSELEEEFDNRHDDNVHYLVRFSLNGKILKSKWEDEHDDPVDMIPLETLQQFVNTKRGI